MPGISTGFFARILVRLRKSRLRFAVLTLTLSVLILLGFSDSAATALAGPVRLAALTPIYTIEGTALSSPLVNTVVTTRGIITGFTSNNDGFFIQDPVGDGNSATSDGIYIFRAGFNLPLLKPGDYVELTGVVKEYFGLTEISLSASANPYLTVLSGGNSVPAVEVNPPADATAAKTYLEAREGMLVKITGCAKVIAPTDKFYQFGVVNPAGPYPDHIFLYDTASHGLVIAVDDSDNPSTGDPPRPATPGKRFSVKMGDRICGPAGLNDTGPSLVGPLDYTFGDYKIEPQAALPVTVISGTALDNPVSGPAANQFTIGSFNTENFFDDQDDPAIPGANETILTPAQFAAKQAKVAQTIAGPLNRPTLLGLQEIENSNVLDHLLLQPQLAGLHYQYVFVNGNPAVDDPRGIDVALLYQSDKVTIQSYKTFQCYDITGGAVNDTGQSFSCSDNGTVTPGARLFPRRPLIVRLQVQPNPGGPAVSLTLIVNHFKSKGGGTTADAEFVRQRTYQAQELAKYIDTTLTPAGETNVALLGDLNDFENSLPLQALTTGSTPGTTMHNLTLDVPQASRYSYNFDYKAQVLDHILLTAPLVSLLKSAAFSHFDADYPYYLDENVTVSEFSSNIANKVSDHDPPEGLFELAAGCSVTPVRLSSDDGNGGVCGSLSYAILHSGSGQTITFQPGLTINLSGAPLPALPDGVSLDGGCTTDPTTGRGVPGVQLNATGISGPQTQALLRLGNSSMINGLKVVGYVDYAVEIGGSNNTITCSWLGTADGATKQANGGGIRFTQVASNNRLGLAGNPTSGNLISGNTGYAILDSATSGANNRFYYNLVGLDKSGLLPLRNGHTLKAAGGARFSFGPGNRFF